MSRHGLMTSARGSDGGRRRGPGDRGLYRSLVVALLLANACSGDEAATPSASTATPKKADPAAGAAAGAQDPNAVAFVYTPIGKRDPFRSYLLEIERQSALAKGGRKKEPTEMFEIDQYHLTAIVTGTSQPKAMVEDPGGRGHVIHLGTRLGKNGGRVTRISGTELVVTEETLDASGKTVRVPITKRLPRAEFDDALKRQDAP